MNTRRIFLLLALAFCLASCKSAFQTGLGQLHLGMTKSEVVNLLGTSYDSQGSFYAPDGEAVEIITYRRAVDVDNDVDYVLQFKDGKLAEWHKEQVRNSGSKPNPSQRPPHDRRNP